MSQLEFSKEGRKMAGVYRNGCIYDGEPSLAMGNSSNGTGSVLNHAGSGYDVGRFHLGNTQASEINMNPVSSFAKQNKLAQQNNILRHHGNYSMYNMNKLSVASQTAETYHDAKIENSVAYTSHQQESSAPIDKSPVLQIPRSSHSHHFTYNLANMTEPSNYELMTSQDYHGNSSHPPHVASFGSLIPSEFPPRIMLHSEILSYHEKLDQKIKIQQSQNTVNQAMHANNNQVVDAMATQEISDGGLQGFMRHSTTDSLEEKQVNYGISGFHLSRNFDIKTSNPYSLDGDQIHSIQEANTARSMSDFATGASHENQNISNILREGALNTGNSTSMTVEKLWDGNLQLNTITTISMLAYFRSGEKSTDIDWPQHIEVKGKVKLEAFEKFVQDLPRSRNRTLMVIALCCKDGSSVSGLTGVKEVARGYNEGQRVGYAQPCSGIDLYICPYSKTIITILAKYGFSKGMQVAEVDQDSLIGCVVWRRNHTPAKFEINNLSSKNSETSPINFSLKMAELNPSISVSKLQYLEHNHQTPLPTVNGVQISNSNDQMGHFVNSGNGYVNSKISQAGNFQIESPEGHPSIPIQLLSQYTTVNSYSQAPADMADSTITMAPKRGKQTKSGDDDDLPEFDFGKACISYQPVTSRNQQTNHVSHESYKKQVSSEGIMHSSITILSQPPLPPGPPPISRQMNASSLQVTSFLRSFPAQSNSLADRAGEKISKNALTAQAIEGNVSATQGANPASVWEGDDDDDIPEWCPPDMKKNAFSQPLLPQLSQTPLPFQPPLPPYPRPASAVPSRPRSPAQIFQKTAEMTPTLSSLGTQSQFHGCLSNNEGLPSPRNMGDLLGSGSQNNNPSMTQRSVAQPFGTCRGVTSRSKPSGLDLKPYMRPYNDETLGSHSSGFEPKPYHRINSDETSGIQSSRFEPNPYQRTYSDRTSGSLSSGFESNPLQRNYPDKAPGSLSSGYEAKPFQRIHPNGTHTSGYQSHGIEVKPGGSNFDMANKHWQQGGFDKEQDGRVNLGHSCNESSKHQSAGFISKQGWEWSPSSKSNEMNKRKRSGFDVLPENQNRSSPGFNSKQFSNRQPSPLSSPNQASRRRRPSLFDVKPEFK